MNEQTAEYTIIHKTDHMRFQKAINELAEEGYTMTGPAQFTVDSDLDDYHYLATMERKVEAREREEA
jgi:hypothetical protein